MVMAVSIGSFEAKTRFAELLRNVEQGFVYSITRNGKSVAVLQSQARAAAAQKKSLGMSAFERIAMRAEKSRGFTLAEIQELKNEGRKY